MVLSEQHVLTSCPAVERLRRETGVSHVFNGLRLVGLEEDEAFYRYTNGIDFNGDLIGRDIFLTRGEAMGEVLDAWLSLWLLNIFLCFVLNCLLFLTLNSKYGMEERGFIVFSTMYSKST